MPESTAPDVSAPHDRQPPSHPDLRAIDLAAPGQPETLSGAEREVFARAGEEALEACLRRFSREERAAFWGAICRCYNRPYNPPDPSLPDAPPPDALPAPHVIEAVRPGLDALTPEVLLR